MNPFDFLQYIPEEQRQSFLSSLTSGGNNVQAKTGFKDSIKKAGSFAMDNAGAVVGAGQGLLELSTNIFGKSGVAEDESGNRMATDIYGRPVYSYQNYQDSIDQISDNAKGEVGRSVIAGAGQGLKAGAAIGSLFPGPGTVVGGAVGLLAGSVGGLLGGNKRKKEMSSEIANREERLQDSVNQFNRDNTSYFEEANSDSISSYLMSQRALRRYS